MKSFNFACGMKCIVFSVDSLSGNSCFQAIFRITVTVPITFSVFTSVQGIVNYFTICNPCNTSIS